MNASSNCGIDNLACISSTHDRFGAILQSFSAGKHHNKNDHRAILPDCPHAVMSKPKRPRTAYNLFFRDQQEKINELKVLYNNKSVNSAAIVSECWKSLTPSRKAYYHKLACDDKIRYYNQKNDYNRSAEDAQAVLPEERAGNQAVALESVQIRPRVEEQASYESEAVRPIEASAVGTAGNQIYETPLYDVPSYSSESIARLASQLDADSIEFLIKAFK